MRHELNDLYGKTAIILFAILVGSLVVIISLNRRLEAMADEYQEKLQKRVMIWEMDESCYEQLKGADRIILEVERKK